MADPKFLRGAKPASRSKLLAARAFRPDGAAPPQVAYVPTQLRVWGNNQYGDCVSAEEAFAKACHVPEILLDDQTVIDWARHHGVLNGAGLTEVMDAMQSDGYQVGPQRYNDGQYQGVDYSSDSVLQAAIAQGPVKIAIDADALPNGAGNQQGWHAFGKGRWPNTDHCVALAGYGSAAFCFQALGAALPAGTDPAKLCYLLFTWGTIGVVDHDWIMGTCVEAWVRNPTTVGVPPLSPEPAPPVPPCPPVPPPVPPVPPAPPVPPVPHVGGPFSGRLAGIVPFSGTWVHTDPSARAGANWFAWIQFAAESAAVFGMARAGVITFAAAAAWEVSAFRAVTSGQPLPPLPRP